MIYAVRDEQRCYATDLDRAKTLAIEQFNNMGWGKRGADSVSGVTVRPRLRHQIWRDGKRLMEAPWRNDFWTPEPLFWGETVFVLASGPSLTQDVCDKVKGHKAIVVNASYKLAPWAPVWYFTDGHIYEKYTDDVLSWPGEIVTMSVTAKEELDQGVKRVKGEGDPAFPFVSFPPVGHHAIRQGRSSGHTAVSLAIALGASRVPLLGFDMRVVDGREHHHDEHKGPRDHEQYAREFVPAFAGWNAAALASGVEIYMCTPGSAVTEFPFAALDEVLSCAQS